MKKEPNQALPLIVRQVDLEIPYKPHVNSVNLAIIVAGNDGSEAKVAALSLEKKNGVLCVQDAEIVIEGITYYVGASVVGNGNMHISLMEGPLLGLKCHLYRLIIVDLMACLKPNVPAQLMGRLRSGKLVRIFVEGK
jgi:hypothetical protein